MKVPIITVKCFLWLCLLNWLAPARSHLMGQHIRIDQEVRMLALGDSYTIGESVDTEARWPHQFVAALREKGLEAQDPDYIATTGWTTSDLLGGIHASLDREKEYNLVSILIGVNNQYQGKDIKLYEPELRHTVDLAIEIADGEGSRVFMLSIPDYAFTPFGKGNPAISREIDTYNEINERVAKDYGIAHINITSLSRRGISEPGLVAKDGLHPSAEQYKSWVDKLFYSAEMHILDDSSDFHQIKELIYQQEKDWNRGDIDAFMRAYWKSDELQFGGATGVTWGWQNTLERYKAGYPDRATMGRLSFQIKDMSRHSANVVSLTGSWELLRENDRPGGHFLLIWKRIGGHWKIVVDHTSQKTSQ